MTAGLVTSVFRGRTLALAGLALAAMVTTTAHAATIFTSNLSSTTTPAGCNTCGPAPTGNNFQLNYNGGTVAGVTNTSPGGVLGYNFVYASPFSANTFGAYNNSVNSNPPPVKLDSAVTADAADSHDGGYFLALDSVYQVAAININFTGIAGQTYTVSFDFGGAQLAGFKGASQDTLSVSLNGGPTQSSTTPIVPEQGFSGWIPVTDTFVAGITGTETLSFLASGIPNGVNQQPAFTLLDNIVISTQATPPPTPEPSSLILLSTGLVGLGGFVRSRIKKSEPSSL